MRKNQAIRGPGIGPPSARALLSRRARGRRSRPINNTVHSSDQLQIRTS